MLRNNKIIWDVLLIIIFCSIYTFWFFDDLNKQGLYCDVALFGNAALSVKDNLPDYCGRVALNLFGKKIPLMLNDYNAATDIYATLPWVYIFGNKPMAVNMPAFIWGLLTSIFIYPACFYLYRSRIYSALVSLILVTSPPFIIASRIGLFTGNLTVFFALISLFFLSIWQVRKEKLWLFAMGLGMGTALAGRIQFLWFINAAFLYILFQKELRKRFFIPKNIIVYSLGLIAGASSFILGNIKGNFLTVQFLGKYLLVSRQGIANLNYFPNLLERLREALSLINSTALRCSVGHSNFIGIYLFLAGLIFIIVDFAHKASKKQQAQDNMQILPLWIFVFGLIQSSFTPTLFHVHHIIFLLPFIYMICSFPFYILLGIISSKIYSVRDILRSPKKILAILLCGVCLAALGVYIVDNYRLLAVYKAHRDIHSGQELKWDVLSDVKSYLDAKGIKKIGLGDTGLMDSLLFLSDFKLDIEEVFFASYKGTPRQEQEKRLTDKFSNEKEGYYLFRTEGCSWINFFVDFKRLAEACGKKVELAHEFKSPDDVPLFQILKVY